MTTMRETRAEETATRRKQRGEGLIGHGKFAFPASMLDLTRFKYRMINHDEARLQVMTREDDWDVVAKGDNVCETADLGDAVTRQVGKMADGKPLLAYLCRKPKHLYDEDQAAKAAELDRQEKELRRGNTRDGSSQADYVPASGIVMRG